MFSPSVRFEMLVVAVPSFSAISTSFTVTFPVAPSMVISTLKSLCSTMLSAALIIIVGVSLFTLNAVEFSAFLKRSFPANVTLTS